MRREQVTALGEGLQILEDAKKAGMRVAGKIRDKGLGKTSKKADWHVPEPEMKKKLLDAFLDFKDKASKSPMFQEKAALQYFLDGFTEAYEHEPDSFYKD